MGYTVHNKSPASSRRFQSLKVWHYRCVLPQLLVVVKQRLDFSKVYKLISSRVPSDDAHVGTPPLQGITGTLSAQRCIWPSVNCLMSPLADIRTIRLCLQVSVLGWGNGSSKQAKVLALAWSLSDLQGIESEGITCWDGIACCWRALWSETLRNCC